mgnify:FL=1
MSDQYLIWQIELEKAGQYKKHGLSIGLRAKIIEAAIKRNVYKMIVKVKEPELELTMKPKEFQKRAIKDKFPSKFGPQFDMSWYYLPLYE